MLSIETDRRRVGQRVQDWRETAGWSRVDLASRARVGVMTLYNLERGQNATYDTLHKVAQALGGSVADLVD